MEYIVDAVIQAFGADAAIGIAILAGFSFIASILDAIWADDSQPEIVSKIIKVLSVNVGRASNNPESQ